MKSYQWLLILMVSVAAQGALAEECGETVDMADSLSFHKLHVECDDKAVDTYEPGLLDKLMGKEKGVDTYDAAASAPVPEGRAEVLPPPAAAAAVATPKDTAGVTFNIREPFTVTGGPQSALNGLFAQMAHYCPKGWDKLKEWAEPSPSGYFLHYQFRCAK